MKTSVAIVALMLGISVPTIALGSGSLPGGLPVPFHDRHSVSLISEVWEVNFVRKNNNIIVPYPTRFCKKIAETYEHEVFLCRDDGYMPASLELDQDGWYMIICKRSDPNCPESIKTLWLWGDLELRSRTVFVVFGCGAPFEPCVPPELPRLLEKARVGLNEHLNIGPIRTTTTYISRNDGYMVWDTLFAIDEKFEIQPQMAESATVSADGKTYTIKLRPGLKWHDGSPVTPDDCIASIQRWGQRDGMGQQMMAVVESMGAVDDLTFTIRLKETWGLVLAALGKMNSNVPFMMPKRLAETDPFEQVPDSKVVYVKNQGYVPRGEPASAVAGVKVDRVEWVYIPDPATTMNALVNGEVDLWETPAVDMVPLLEQQEGIELAVIDPIGTQGWLRPNHLHFPFNHPSARRALLYAVNQEDYLRAIVGDPKLYRVCPAYFICGTPNESSVGVEALQAADLDKARALLKEAGYKEEKIILMQPTDIPDLNTASFVTAQALRDIGMDVEVQAMDWSTLTSRQAETKPSSEGGWNIFHQRSTGADVTSPVANIGGSGGGTGKAWFGWPDDSEIEALRQAFARETNPAKQTQLTSQIQERALDSVTHLPIGQYLQYRAMRGNPTGFLAAPVPFVWDPEGI